MTLYRVWLYTGFTWPISIRAPHAEAARKYGLRFGNVTDVQVPLDNPHITISCDENGCRVEPQDAEERES